MKGTYSGGCACGAIRYEARGEPIFQNHCQCQDCQKRSGTGHSSYMTFVRAGVVVSGAATQWSVLGDSGNEKVHAFCPTCGTPVYLTLSAMPEVLAVHVGSLDEPGRFRPDAVTYGRSGQAWDRIDATVATFDRMAG